MKPQTSSRLTSFVHRRTLHGFSFIRNLVQDLVLSFLNFRLHGTRLFEKWFLITETSKAFRSTFALSEQYSLFVSIFVLFRDEGRHQRAFLVAPRYNLKII